MPEKELNAFELGLRVGELQSYLREGNWVLAYDTIDSIRDYLENYFSISPSPSGALRQLRDSFNERSPTKSVQLLEDVLRRLRSFLAKPIYNEAQRV